MQKKFFIYLICIVFINVLSCSKSDQVFIKDFTFLDKTYYYDLEIGDSITISNHGDLRYTPIEGVRDSAGIIKRTVRYNGSLVDSHYYTMLVPRD